MTTRKNMSIKIEDFDIELTLGRRPESEEGRFWPLFDSLTSKKVLSLFYLNLKREKKSPILM